MAELLRAGRRRVADVWIADGIDSAPIVDTILQEADRRQIPVRRVPRHRLDAEAATTAPQGVLAHAEPLPEADLDDLCQDTGAGGQPPFLLAIDGVTDPGNVGALLRSAEGAGATGVILPKHRASRVTPAVAKAAAGAIEHLPIAMVPGMPSALARAKDAGCWVVGLTGDAGSSLFELSLADQPLVVVVGAEGEGLSRLVRDRCDVLAAIPLAGALPSLNVSAAGALALFEVARKRHTSSSPPRRSPAGGENPPTIDTHGGRS
ncbi:MAG: rRNA (guanosine2251-2-O)-methyltransferase [Actinomycetota bacterium]|nr:rRNA (guanosine2251-2-O)-methyltransferase [Actinomycetota bacterium]